MEIKDGYNNKETNIRIGNPRTSGRVAELWIEQTGLESKETLSYITLEELLDLKDEIDEAVKTIVRIELKP